MWVVYSIDAWGNNDEGYEYNDTFYRGKARADEDLSNDELFEQVFSLYVNGKASDYAYQETCSNCIELYDKETGQPYFYAEYISEGEYNGT